MWGRDPFGSLSFQIEQLARQRTLGAPEADALFAELHAVVDETVESLYAGAKTGGGRLTLYENGAHAMSPSVVTEAGAFRSVSFVTTNPAYVRSVSPAAFEHFAAQFERRRARSRLIGGPGLPLDRSWGPRQHERLEASHALVRSILDPAG